MPMRIRVDPETGRAIGVATGELDLEDLKASAKTVWSDACFGRSEALWDLREATFSLSAEEVRELAAFAKAAGVLRSPARLAFIVSGDVEFGQARMYEVFRDQPGVETMVFRDFEAAEAWLEER